MLALGAALTIVGTLIGRRVAGPTRSGTHLYVVALAGTGAGKQHAIDCIKSALIAARAKSNIGPGDFTSSRAVVKLLKRQPLSLCAMDEFGAFLRRIGNRNAGHFETAITGELRKLWGISFSRYDSAETAKEDSEAVECPALTIFGLSTPDEFYGALKSEDIGNGFLNRFLIIETGEARKTSRHQVATRSQHSYRPNYGSSFNQPHSACESLARPPAANWSRKLGSSGVQVPKKFIAPSRNAQTMSKMSNRGS